MASNNFVAKHAHRFNRCYAHKDITQYDRNDTLDILSEYEPVLQCPKCGISSYIRTVDLKGLCWGCHHEWYLYKEVEDEVA